MTDRTELRRLLERATPGPWHAWDRGIGYEVHTEAEHNPIRCVSLNSEFRETFRGPDARLIAAAVNALPALLDAAAERDALTTVLPCDEKHEPPYDFAYCETHDRTFALGDHCDHAGLSAWSYLDERERQQRGRAVRAEMRDEEAEAERDALAAKLGAVREWIDRRGVNVDDRDDDYMRGYRDAQRYALHDANELRALLDATPETGGES